MSRNQDSVLEVGGVCLASVRIVHDGWLEVGLSCLSGLSGAGLLSDLDNSPFNIHNSQLSEPKLVITTDRRLQEKSDEQCGLGGDAHEAFGNRILD